MCLFLWHTQTQKLLPSVRQLRRPVVTPVSLHLQNLISHAAQTPNNNHYTQTPNKPSVRRIKAVMLDWLPRRLDPLAFYYWRRPLHNLLALWVLSHACLHPGQWLMAVSLLFTLVMLRHMAIQVSKCCCWCRVLVGGLGLG